MKTILLAGALALIGATALPGAASAELYQYVACNGSVKATNADTWQAALVTTPDLATHSGVIESDGGSLEISSSMVVSGTSC